MAIYSLRIALVCLESFSIEFETFRSKDTFQYLIKKRDNYFEFINNFIWFEMYIKYIIFRPIDKSFLSISIIMS